MKHSPDPGRGTEVHAFEAGRSAGGLPSYALELTVPRKTGWWSRAKLCGWKQPCC